MSKLTITLHVDDLTFRIDIEYTYRHDDGKIEDIKIRSVYAINQYGKIVSINPEFRDVLVDACDSEIHDLVYEKFDQMCEAESAI